MASQKVCKQGMKAKVNILAKPHPYILFTLQLDSVLESDHLCSC